ncbi:sigma factor G inhibitor Gin [Salimicrobium halophilum]|uniref:Inhibitor of sigma-G Gin n=1 Tax=Salimicrobium halophilum TaxID=86666 RepID=A0A1G8W1J6_9BACI|nr:sigma factor G inhibitor Gin [Salimicrobium halophilum]SDJ71966.1 Inhibitor of sigma-G Gin [Salimicrobium halophilum]
MAKCTICNRTSENGIRFLQAYICHTCEKELLELKATDPRYREVIEKLKQASYSTTF